MKVKLKKDSRYISSKDNPKIESEYECYGVITERENSMISNKVKTLYYVNWNNGHRNTYYNEDLIYIDDKLTYLNNNFKSIW